MDAVTVYGTTIDEQTRCSHYHSELDIIAIQHKCCHKYYACIQCHNEAESHLPEVWLHTERATQAILCGVCKTTLSISKYLTSHNECPHCQSLFNPKCSNHYHLYFQMGDVL